MQIRNNQIQPETKDYGFSSQSKNSDYTINYTSQVLANDQANNKKKVNSASASNQHGDTLHITGTEKKGALTQLYEGAQGVYKYVMSINSSDHKRIDGEDSIIITSSNNVKADLLSGTDTAAVFGNSDNIELNMGTDSDEINIGKMAKNVTANLGEGDDKAKIELSKNMQGMKKLDGGEGNDILRLKLDRDMSSSEVKIIKNPDNDNGSIVNVNGIPVIEANNFKEIKILNYTPI